MRRERACVNIYSNAVNRFLHTPIFKLLKKKRPIHSSILNASILLSCRNLAKHLKCTCSLKWRLAGSLIHLTANLCSKRHQAPISVTVTLSRGRTGRKRSATRGKGSVIRCVHSLVNQTVFRERACARERGRGGRKNTVWPNWPGFRGISYLASRSRCDQSDYWYAVII